MRTPHHLYISNICHMNISCNLQSTTHMFVIQLIPHSSVFESCDRVVLCLMKRPRRTRGRSASCDSGAEAPLRRLHTLYPTEDPQHSRAMPRLIASRWLLPCSRPCVFADAMSKLSPLRLPSSMTQSSRGYLCQSCLFSAACL